MCVLTMGIIAGVNAYRSAQSEANALQTQAFQESLASSMSQIQSDVARQNAENARVKAGMEIESGESEAADKSREVKQETGSGLAKAAGSGVMIEGRKESVSTMYEADQKAELAYDQAKIMHNAQLKAWGYQANADILDQQANETLRAGRAKARMGYISAASSALSAGLSTYGGVKTLLT